MQNRNELKAAALAVGVAIVATFVLMSTFDYWSYFLAYHVIYPGGSIGIRL